MNQGKLVPEDIIFGLLSKRLEEGYSRGETGFILDGIPRTRIQAVSQKLFLTLSLEDELIFHLVVTTCYATKYYMLSLSNVSHALTLANKMGNELKEVLLFRQGLVYV